MRYMRRGTTPLWRHHRKRNKMNITNKLGPNPTTEKILRGGDCPPTSCSAWRFKFSAEHPPESNMVGGTFLEGDLECEPEDLPEAAVAILKNAFEEWDTEGQTHISLNIEPNASVETSPKAK